MTKEFRLRSKIQNYMSFYPASYVVLLNQARKLKPEILTITIISKTPTWHHHAAGINHNLFGRMQIDVNFIIQSVSLLHYASSTSNHPTQKRRNIINHSSTTFSSSSISLHLNEMTEIYQHQPRLNQGTSPLSAVYKYHPLIHDSHPQSKIIIATHYHPKLMEITTVSITWLSCHLAWHS